jgi:hypothetical protein
MEELNVGLLVVLLYIAPVVLVFAVMALISSWFE